MLSCGVSAYAFQFQPQWIKTGGPLGGLGYNVRIHPANKNIMFVTDAFSGAHRTTNGGQSWQDANTGITTRVGQSLDAIPVFSLTIDKNNPNIVWVGTQGVRGIFKSTDGGLSFAKMDNGITETELTIRNFEVHPTNSNIVFATGELPTGIQGREFEKVKGVLYKTTDGGTSWTKLWQGNSLARWLCVNETDPQKMIMATGIFDREAFNTTGEGILETSDGGVTWTASNQGLTSLFVGGMADHPTNAGTILIGTGNITEDNTGKFGAVHRSTDGGVTWTQLLGPHDPQAPGSPDNIFTATAYAPSNGQILYAANAIAFYRSSDGGATWSRYAGQGNATYGPPGIKAGFPIEITVDKNDPNTLFVNNYGGGVFKSTDGAQTWQDLSKGYTGAFVKKVVVDPKNKLAVFASGRSGSFKSTNAGDQWIGTAYGPLSEGAWELWGAAIHPTNPSQLLLSDLGQGVIFSSSDGGRSWKEAFRHPLANASDPNTRHGAKELVYAPSNPQIIYAGFAAGAHDIFNEPENTTFSVSLGISKSTDGGATWITKNSGLGSTNLNITAMAVSTTDPSLVYIGTRGSGVYKSINGGDSWTNITSTIASSYIFSLAISPSNANIVYAGTRDAGIYKSTNGGTSWNQSLSGTPINSNFTSKIIMSIVIDQTNENIAYASDYTSGLYKTIDGGTSWQLSNTNLTTRAVTSLSLSSDGLLLYAATQGEGIFRLQTSAVAAPTAPAPTSPANGAINQQLNLTLSWGAVMGADSYDLQVSTNPNFTTLFLEDSTLTAPSRQLGTLALNTTYYWRVSAKNLGGTSPFSSTFNFKTVLSTSVENVGNEIPKEFGLSQNYPNPFNPSTTIEFQIPKNSHVTLKVFDPLGKELLTLLQEEKNAGSYKTQWDANNLPSGVYFYRLQAGNFVDTKKLILMK